MTPLAQVVHVMRRDLRQHLGFAIAFALLVVLAVMRSGGVVVPGAGSELGVMPLVLLAMLVAAAAVQADAPLDPTNFWATRPLDPRAVLAAKLGVALLLLAVAVLGQLAALAILGVAPGDMGMWTTDGALSFAQWVVAAMVLGAVTRDLRTLAIALLGGAVGGVVLTVVLDAPLRMILVAVSPALQLLWPVAALALLAWVFMTRDAAWYVRAAGVALMVLVPVTHMLGDVGLSLRRRLPEAPALPRITGRVLLPDLVEQAAGVSGFTLRVRVEGARPGWKFRLTGAQMVLTLADGRPIRVDGARDQHDLTPDSATSGEVFIPLPSPTVRDAVRNGVRDAVIQGQVIASEMRVVDTLPWRKGATVTRDGMRVAVEKVEGPGGAPRLGVRVGGVIRDRTSFVVGQARSAMETHFSLVNRRTGEVVRLQNRMAEYGPSGLVLPQLAYREVYAEYEPLPGWAMRTPHAVRVDDAWLRDARIVVRVETVRGGYPVVWGSN